MQSIRARLRAVYNLLEKVGMDEFQLRTEVLQFCRYTHTNMQERVSERETETTTSTSKPHTIHSILYGGFHSIQCCQWFTQRTAATAYTRLHRALLDLGHCIFQHAAEFIDALTTRVTSYKGNSNTPPFLCCCCRDVVCIHTRTTCTSTAVAAR